MAAPAAGRGEDLLAGRRIALAAAASSSAPAASASAAVGLRRDGALYGLGAGGGLLLAAAAGCNGQRHDGEREGEDACHRAGSIPAAAAT